MGTVTTPDGTEIYYKDWGTGQPIVFSHGWPLSADDWDNQMLFFLGHGYRVIAHDRRGHGRSAQMRTATIWTTTPTTCAAVEHLDLRDAIHVGHRPAAGRWRATRAVRRGPGREGRADQRGAAAHC